MRPPALSPPTEPAGEARPAGAGGGPNRESGPEAAEDDTLPPDAPDTWPAPPGDMPDLGTLDTLAETLALRQ